MKRIYLILSIFTFVFTSCETDFDVNSSWEETTVVYGLLDVSTENQYIRINKAYLGEADAMMMAHNSDSINFSPAHLEVKLYKLEVFGDLTVDTLGYVTLEADTLEKEDGLFATDNNIIYRTPLGFEDFFSNNNRYALIIKNKNSGNKVSANTGVISGFDFDNVFRNNNAFQFGFYNNNDYSLSTVTWDDSNDNGKIYQLDLVINYIENGINKQLVFSQPLVDKTATKMSIEGESFFNFLRAGLIKDNTKVRYFNSIDMVMTVGSEDLDTYIKINKPITGIVQERPQFSNINNGIGLFSSRFTKIRYSFPLTSASLDFLKSTDGLDRNFQ